MRLRLPLTPLFSYESQGCSFGVDVLYTSVLLALRCPMWMSGRFFCGPPEDMAVLSRSGFAFHAYAVYHESVLTIRCSSSGTLWWPSGCQGVPGFCGRCMPRVPGRHLKDPGGGNCQVFLPYVLFHSERHVSVLNRLVYGGGCQRCGQVLSRTVALNHLSAERRRRPRYQSRGLFHIVGSSLYGFGGTLTKVKTKWSGVSVGRSTTGGSLSVS